MGRDFPTTFFILGASKSGTTSLHDHLCQHPDISMARIKETNHFADRCRRVTTIDGYTAEFDARPEALQFGESSHIYFTSPECPPRLRDEFPDARFLLILRDPVERAHSLYLHNRIRGWESARTFERALALEPRRAASGRFQRRSPDHPTSYQYVESGRYDELLDRYFALYPREQFLITTFDEFTADPESFLLDCHRFLGVAPTPLDAYPVLMRRQGIPRFAGTARRVSNSYRRGGPARQRLAERLRASRVPVPALHPETVFALRAEFEPSVRRLADMLDRPPLWWTSD